jgi:hypothetical protein
MPKTPHRIVPSSGVLFGLWLGLLIPDTLAGPPAGPPQPASSGSAPRPLVYTSPAGQASDPGDPPPVPWAQSNRTVGVLGGHAGHLRGTAPAARPASAPPGTPAPGAAGKDRP